MVFSSILFMFVYLPVVLAVYYIIPQRARNFWLFTVNLLFYGWGEPVYILLMMLSITINYLAGLLIEKYKEQREKARLVLTVNVVINLGLLVFFKYFGLLVSTLTPIIPPLSALSHIRPKLPIGISFYTFQTMSYPIDLYRGDSDVQRDYISFGTFVALFPQLIAGPIVRYKDVASQLGFRSGSIEQFASGIRRFTVGLGKKVLLANNLGSLWDIYAATPSSELTALGAWLGIAAFSLQIYFDFSGYSDMAIGLGRMLGFEFLENFNYPYISKSITEFWRRWHMSLGTWFRDYLYIPLGGNRCSFPRQMFNIMVVWAATGIWHGANWTFLLWGIYYGILLIIEKQFLLRRLEKAPAIVSRVYVMLLTALGWVMFQLNSISECTAYIRAMFGFGAGALSPADLYHLRSYALMLVIGAVASTELGTKFYNSLSEPTRAVLAPALITLTLLGSTAYLVASTYNPFLYFIF